MQIAYYVQKTISRFQTYIGGLFSYQTQRELFTIS